MKKKTPSLRPWRILPKRGPSRIFSASDKEGPIGSFWNAPWGNEQGQINAHHAIQCVNAYEDLVQTCIALGQKLRTHNPNIYYSLSEPIRHFIESLEPTETT